MCGGSHTRIVVLLARKHRADVTIRDKFQRRSPLEVAQYRQFHDIVLLLSQAAEQQRQDTLSSAGEERGPTYLPAERSAYLRSSEEIEKEGQKAALQGIHKRHLDLFLGRYLLPAEVPHLIEEFRQSTSNPGMCLILIEIDCMC